MQKSKGLFLLKRAGLLALVLISFGAQRAATPGPGALAPMAVWPVAADAGPAWYAGTWPLGGTDWMSATGEAGDFAGTEDSAGTEGAGLVAVSQNGVGTAVSQNPAGMEVSQNSVGMDGGQNSAGIAVNQNPVGIAVSQNPVGTDGEISTRESRGGNAIDGAHGSAGALDWMSIGEVGGELQKEERPVLIDLYTTWCGWCKQMDRKTYSNKQVAAYLQEKFYPVKVDAETHAVINWKGKEYRFSTNYRSNEFAVYLTHGKLEFPTTIIIPPGGEPQAIPGYMEPKELELLVKYFGEGKFNKVGFDEFQKSFRPSW